MTILTISGSSRPNSVNSRLLKVLPFLFPEHHFQFYAIDALPLFKAEED